MVESWFTKQSFVQDVRDQLLVLFLILGRQNFIESVSLVGIVRNGLRKMSFSSRKKDLIVKNVGWNYFVLAVMFVKNQSLAQSLRQWVNTIILITSIVLVVVSI